MKVLVLGGDGYCGWPTALIKEQHVRIAGVAGVALFAAYGVLRDARNRALRADRLAA